MIALFIVQNVVIAFVFFYLGKNQERTEWNKLIKDGILPKPKQQEQCKCGKPRVGGYSCQRTDCNQTFKQQEQ
jgi:hypothetical protein